MGEHVQLTLVNWPNTSQQYSSFQFLTSAQHGEVPDIDDIVEAGFEYIGDGIFHCKTCGIRLARWKRADEVWKEHARYGPQCSYLRQKKGQDYIDSVQTEFTTQIYTPQHPQLSELDSREQTFRNPNWPAQLVKMTPEQLAIAGFFYTGENATIICHYCDVSLNCLEPHTEPWANHALLSPSCKYLIKMKGIDYVENFTPTNIIDVPVSPVSMDPSTPVQILRSMRFSHEVITAAVDQYTYNTGTRDFRVGDLLSLISNMDGRDTVVEDQHGMPSYEEVEEMNRGLPMCRICPELPATTVSLPCLHLCLCDGCAGRITICPDCNQKVTPVGSPVLGRRS